jgi:hypothetical protein
MMIRPMFHFFGFTSTAGDSGFESLHTALSLEMACETAQEGSQKVLR